MWLPMFTLFTLLGALLFVSVNIKLSKSVAIGQRTPVSNVDTGSLT